MNRDAAAQLVAPFYDALNRPATKDVAALVTSVADENWRSYSGESVSKGREEFIKQVIGFGKLIPDLTWAIKEVFADNDRIIVRSEAAGTPAVDFMGVPHSGQRFAIMTIDVHTVREGKLVAAHHVEDWAGALRQLTVKKSTPANHCIEIATFKLKPGVSEEALLAVEAQVQAGGITRQPGYIGRELAKDEQTGDWLMILRFDTRAHMDDWMAAVKQVPEMRSMGALIEMGSMTTRFFTRAEAPAK